MEKAVSIVEVEKHWASYDNYDKMNSHKDGFYFKCERKNSWLLQSNTAQ